MGVTRQRTTVRGGSLRKPPRVCLEVATQQIGRTLDVWVFGNDKGAELAKCAFGVADRAWPKAERELLEVALDGGYQGWGVLGERGPGRCARRGFRRAMTSWQLVADTSMKEHRLGAEQPGL